MINKQEFLSHVIQEYPKEACGIILNEEFIPFQNCHSDPVNHFMFSEEDSKNLSQQEDLYKVIHSHTQEKFSVDPRSPSEADMKGQKITGVPWGIVHCDGELVSDLLYFGASSEVPLLGRPYISNVYDCFTLVRDYYFREFELDLGSHPRPINWIEWNPYYIEETYRSLGFKEVSSSEYSFGDVVLLALGSSTINHLGVIYKKGEFLHHLANRKSRSDSLQTWERQISKRLRYDRK